MNHVDSVSKVERDHYRIIIEVCFKVLRRKFYYQFMVNHAAITQDCISTQGLCVHVYRKWIYLYIVQAIGIMQGENFYTGIFEETAWEEANRGIWCELAMNTVKCALWNVHMHMESMHLLGTKVHMPEDIYREEYFCSACIYARDWAWSYKPVYV